MILLLAAITPQMTASIAIGAVAVAVLYALHHLRIQPVRQPVATLIFWKEATRKQQARMPWAPKLAHLWTFLLLSLIGIVIAASLSADQWGRRKSSEDKNAIVIDIGASMNATIGTTAQTSLAKAIQSALADLGRMSDTPAVIAAGTQPALLVQPGDPIAIAKRKISDIRSSNSASASALALNLAGDYIGSATGAIYWYTNQNELPAGVATVVANRVKIIRQPLPIEAVSITSANFVGSGSNETIGTLHIKVSGESAKAFSLEAKVGIGNPVTQPLKLQSHEAEVSFQNLPADGQLVSLSLKDAPGSPAEQTTTFQLPLIVPLKFNFIGSIPRPLRLALLAIGSEAPESNANIIVIEQGQPMPANAPAVIEVVEQGPNFSSGTLQVEPASSSLADLSFEDVSVPGGHEVPSLSQPLLRVGGAVVAGLSNVSGRKTLYVSREIVDEDSRVPRRAVFPVLLLRLSAYLTGWSQAPATTTSLRRVVDPLWSHPDTSTFAADTIFEPPLTANNQPKSASSIAIQSSGSPAIGWSEVSLVIALALLVFEGSLYAAKKIV